MDDPPLPAGVRALRPSEWDSEWQPRFGAVFRPIDGVHHPFAPVGWEISLHWGGILAERPEHGLLAALARASGDARIVVCEMDPRPSLPAYELDLRYETWAPLNDALPIPTNTSDLAVTGPSAAWGAFCSYGFDLLVLAGPKDRIREVRGLVPDLEEERAAILKWVRFGRGHPFLTALLRAAGWESP